MKLSAVKSELHNVQQVVFELENGTPVPTHFHITEIGQIEKKFIDCGGVIRFDKKINFQLWNANDTEHLLKPSKLLQIIELAEEKLGISDAEIEVEYQADTIGKYGLYFKDDKFILQNLQTACLAADACGISVHKTNEPIQQNACCSSTSSCC
ncbi:MAG: DUF6428 family protein [Chitinophagaceae bacterium]